MSFHFRYFDLQLGLAETLDLPLFLHCRNSASDLVSALAKRQNLRGVVHSFDGTEEEARAILDLGYSIGINGW
jgi:TatD DNase family protein